MSKHAVEACTGALAAEMERFDVKVSVNEPGNYRSNISLSARKRMTEQDYALDDSPLAEDSHVGWIALPTVASKMTRMK